MSKRPHIDGTWPDPITFRRGWAKATARLWNDDVPDVALRLHRGSGDFLVQSTETAVELSAGRVLSPALYPSAARVWKRSGYKLLTALDVMERQIGPSIGFADHSDVEFSPSKVGELAEIDRSAFDEFWRMGVDGLKEAYAATPQSAILGREDEGRIAGYAIVGSHSGVAFLQRVAVRPDFRGAGHGVRLVEACLRWAGAKGGRTMVLNVRPENQAARKVYERTGFEMTGTKLELLEYNG